MAPARRLLCCLVAALLGACSTMHDAWHSGLVRADTQTVGRARRMSDGWQVTWPAVAWRTRFAGTSLGIDMEDRAAYHVEIDGKLQSPVPATPTRLTTWYRGLAPGTHTVEIIRMGPTRRAPGQFFGFVLGTGGRWLPMPAPPARQLLMIADSGATGYGNLSTTVDCGDDVLPMTDASQSYPVVAARLLHADWQLDAMDGIGVVRNWRGIWPGTNYGTYAARTLQSDPDSTYIDAQWRPQVAVVSIGANDLATPLAATEPWTDASLREAFIAAYHELLMGVRRALGSRGLIIVMTEAATDNPANQIFIAQVAALRAAGDQRIYALAKPPLEHTACDYHPSLASHHLLGGLLAQFIEDHQGFVVAGSAGASH